MNKLKRYMPTSSGYYGEGYMVESALGEWVEYDDIKDDRALLEEAVKIIKQCDNLEYDSDRMESFLARAKERLG